MKTKATKFSKKLLALFLAVLMAMSCFTGALTAFASSKDDYHDLNVTANFLNWAELTDDDTAEALLDWADSMLRGVNYYLNIDISIAKIQGTIDSVDGILNIVKQASDVVEQYKGTLGGDIKNINLTAINDLATNSDTLAACGVGYRSCNNAKDIVLTVAKLLYQNSNNVGSNKNIIRQFLIGEFNIGTLLKTFLPMFIGTSDIYQLIGDLLNLPSGYKSNMVYNIVQTLILNAFYKDSNSDAYIEAKAKKLDTLMFDLLSSELLDKISVLVTYGLEVTGSDGKETTDNSAYRYKEIMAHVKSCSACNNYAQAAAHLGYDPNLIYSEESQFKNNILLFAYGAPDANGHATADTQLINLDETDNLFDFALKALKMAWQTVLKDTLGLVHVNYATDRGHGSNFDNVYYYWARQNLAGGWNENDLAAMYSMDNLNAWANSTTVGDLKYKDGQWVDKLGNAYTNTTNKTEKISDDKIINVTDEDGRVVQQASMTLFNDYGAVSAEEFLGWVKDTLTYDREVAADATGTWRDIDATQLFAKLRYSPLADYGFNMQTGPINLYLMQTGFTEIENFFDGLIKGTDGYNYSSMVAGFNDCLVAAVYDLFPQKDNINGTRPTLATTGNTTDAGTIATTLVENAALVFQYAADAADKNILNAFYNDPSINGGSTQISEKNLEAAAMPLLIACIREVDMLDPIHDGEWDACKDAEGVAYLALTEYLSYVLPDNDYSIEKNADGKYDIDFNATILPMTRDALGYILQSLTPIVDENGNESFNAYHPEKYTNVTVWDVLNDIICYMADDMGIAAVLGIFDANGKCAITRNNTIWQNIDLVVNKYLPVLGELQYGDASKAGAASSEDLIWNDIVQGVLNIGNTNESTGYRGITNFMYRLFTFVSAPPISSTPVVQTVYSLVEKLINAIFGARYSGQTYSKIVPTLEDLNSLGYSTNSPFDAVIQKNVICYWDTTNATGGDGFVGSLITNLYEIFGGNGYATKNADQVKSTWEGAMFAVRSVNSFIPSFVPQVGAHTLGSLQALVTDASVQRNANSVYESTVKVTNTSTGVNRFYNDANGKQLEQGRYYMQVSEITTDNSAYTVTYTQGQILAPEETAVYSIKCNSTANADTTVGVTVKYNVYQSTVDRDTGVVNNTAKLLNTTPLTTTTYLFVTPEADWYGNAYTRGPGENDEAKRFSESDEPDAGKTGTYAQATPAGGTSNQLYITTPKELVISSNNVNEVGQMGARIRNTSGKYVGSTRAVDGVYVYPTNAIDAYAVSGTTVAETTSQISGQNYAYCAIDVENGNILNYNLFDYSTDDGQTWNRGTKQSNYRDIYSGYTQDEIDTIEAAQGPDSLFVTRPHVAYTFEEACAQNLINAVQRTKTADGYTYQAVFFNTNYDKNVTTQMLEGKFSDNGKHSISFSTPTNGLYLTMNKTEQAKNSSKYVQWLGYDGVTKLETENYTMSVMFYTTNNTKMIANINVYTVDTSDSGTLDSTYQQYNNWLAGYQPSDFTNADAFTDLQAALKDALSARSKPINSNTASQFSSKMERIAKTETTTSIFGDEAYVPVTEAQYSTLPASIAAYTYKANGYLYWNSTFTQPVYTRTAITDSDVSGITTETIDGKTYTVGKIATNVNVIKNPEDNVWYLKNAVAYKYEWDTTTYDGIPYYGTTNVQEKDKDGKLLYLKDQFAYRTAAGVKTTSKDTVSPWAYKVAELTDRIIPNTSGTENRGLYQRAIDALKYYGEVAEKAISAEALPAARVAVSDLRKGMNNVNFNVVTYEQMVKAGKEVESMYSYDAYKDYYREKDVTYDADGNPVIAPGATVIFSCLDSKYDKTFKDFVENGGYRQIKLVGIEDRSKTVYSTSQSALKVSNAVDTFNLFYQGIQSRGYIGDKIVAEVVCASGDSFDKFTVTQAPAYGKDEDGKTIVTTPAVISVADGANIVRGAVENGVLVNKGKDVYTEESWNMFVARLADAITNCKDADDTVSKTYTIKSDLKIAENKLALAAAEPVEDTYNVSASLVVAINNKGATNGVKVCGDYTITVYNDANEVVAETAFTSSLENNTFNLQLPDGTYTASITSQYSMERNDITIIVNGADVAGPAIPIVACNFDGNTNISPADAIAIYNAKSLTDSNAYLNLDGNSSISPADAVIVYGCSNGAISLEPVVIQ